VGLTGALQAAPTRFAVSHAPDPAEGWLELIADGLTFDLTGLAPAAAAPMPELLHPFGFAAGADVVPGEAITLIPGEHLRGGEHLLPVVRVMTGIAARLGELAPVKAIAWHPARSVMAPDVFIRLIAAWLAGGAFPALGLTALTPDTDFGLRSEGLTFFTGQELRIEPGTGTTAAADAKIAVRLIHYLVENEAIRAPFDFLGPDGESLCAAPSDNGRYLRVWRKP
jgi:hypothetical protein